LGCDFKKSAKRTNSILFPGDAIEVATFNEGVKVKRIYLTSEIPYKQRKI
jgi:hypothetical protein